MFELTGKLTYMVGFTGTGNPIITMEINERQKALEMVDQLHDEALSIWVGKYDPKRSLSANAYYWSMLNKLCRKLNISSNYCHNLMLRRYGVVEDFDGQCAYWVIPDTEEAARKADEAEEYHIKPTAEVREGKNGAMYRTYIQLKGSHSFTRDEFRALLEGLLEECRIQGIETRCQEDIDSMMASYRGK